MTSPTPEEVAAVGLEIARRWVAEAIEGLALWREAGPLADAFAGSEVPSEKLAAELAEAMNAIAAGGPGPRERRFLSLSQVNRP